MPAKPWAFVKKGMGDSSMRFRARPSKPAAMPTSPQPAARSRRRRLGGRRRRVSRRSRKVKDAENEPAHCIAVQGNPLALRYLDKESSKEFAAEYGDWPGLPYVATELNSQRNSSLPQLNFSNA